jgi:hypothetical protein
MKANLKELTLTNGAPLESLLQKPPFDFTVQVVVGPEIDPGEEIFDFSVNLGMVLAEDVAPSGYLWREKTLMLPNLDIQKIQEAVQIVISNSESDNWQAIVDKLKKYMRWEFDGM